MEIEKKYLIHKLPDNLKSYPHKVIRQGYISTSPVIRIRQIADMFILTIKGQGFLEREEHELALSKDQFQNLSSKVEGIVIHKTRYYIPYLQNTIELDVFHDNYEGLYLAEVEFKSVEDANAFRAPNWFGEDVTYDESYHNNNLSQKKE